MIKIMNSTIIHKIDFALANRILVVASLFLITGFVYYSFTTFQPKSLRELPEVKGIDNTYNGFVPTPTDSLIVGEDSNRDFNTTVVKTRKKIDEVSVFYTNIANIKKWKMIENSNTANGFTRVFSANGQTIRINVTKSDNNAEQMNYISVSILES